MVTKNRKALGYLAALLLFVPACAFVQEHRKTAIGAGVGAAAGALGGGLYKGSKGALVGGLIGAVAGGAVGAYLDHKDKTAEDTYDAYDYQPVQGVRVELVSVAADPQAVGPGEGVTLRAMYAVMAPDTQWQIQARESRLVTLNGATVAETAQDVLRAPGTYTSEVPITLPSDAAQGIYQVLVNVTAEGLSTQHTSTFTVN
jgi:hypothetical protein